MDNKSERCRRLVTNKHRLNFVTEEAYERITSSLNTNLYDGGNNSNITILHITDRTRYFKTFSPPKGFLK